MKSELEYVLKELAQYIIYGEENLTNAYKKEEIIQLDQNITEVNKIYNKFNKIEQDNFWRMRQSHIFYRQAKYVENFEDNYPISEVYKNDFHNFKMNYTYEGFSYKDFRTYFSWRTKIRKGIFEKIDWEYEQIYINELVNKIGCKDANEAIEKLVEFWKGYRQCEPKIDDIMPGIIKEFYITHTINTPYTEIANKYPINIKSQTQDLKDVKKGIYSNKIQFFNEISTYKIEKSKLLETKYGYLLNECIEKVFTKIHQEFENKKISLPDMLVHKNMPEYWWSPLANYDIYEWEAGDKEIIIEGTEKYECQNGMWKRTMYSSQKKYKNTIGYLLKTMECYIRDYLGYRKLKFPDKKDILKDIYEYYCTIKEKVMIQRIYDMDLQKIIQTQILQYLENTKVPKKVFMKKKEEQNEFEQEEKIEVVFNQEKFAKIREKSEEIQKALIIEENAEQVPEKEIKAPMEKIEGRYKEVAKAPMEKIEEHYKEVAKTPIEKIEETYKEVTKTPAEIEENTNENIFKKFVYNLTDTEKNIVQILLKKQDVENNMLQIAQAHNEMLEVMVSNINDKALETIGDTIIESNMTSIYEDYENEIKQVL